MQDDNNTAKQDKRKYYQILGLDEDAGEETIKKAYSILLKKHKGDKEKVDEISAAYNRLMGFYVIDEEEERYAASGAGKFGNFWYHNKIPVIVIVITAFALVVLVINSIRNVPTDVNLHFIGDLYVRDIDEVYEDVLAHLENAKAPNVEQLIIEGGSFLEIQLASDARMKLTSLIASGQLDVIICDSKTFEYLAGQGLFMPLEVSKTEEGLFEVKDGTLNSGDLKLNDTLNKAIGKSEETSSNQTEKNQEKQENDYAVYANDNLGKELLLGIRLEGTKFLDFTNIEGRDLILSLYHQPDNYDLAFEMVDLVLNFDPATLVTEEDEWD